MEDKINHLIGAVEDKILEIIKEASTNYTSSDTGACADYISSCTDLLGLLFRIKNNSI